MLRRSGLRPKTVIGGTPAAKGAKVCSSPGFRSRGLTDGVWLGFGRVVGFRCELLVAARSSVGVSRSLAASRFAAFRPRDRPSRSVTESVLLLWFAALVLPFLLAWFYVFNLQQRGDGRAGAAVFWFLPGRDVCFFFSALFVLLVRAPDSCSAAYSWAVVSA